MVSKVISKKKYATSVWSGGTTTQMYIFPETADFKTGDFSFRISSAAVTDEESVFTKLEGVRRILMLLEGSITLTHEGHHEKKLHLFETDYFSGNWTTHSSGIGTDLNLMLKGKKGDMYAVDLSQDSSNPVWLSSVVLPETNMGFFAFLCMSNSLIIREFMDITNTYKQNKKDPVILESGDLFVTHWNSKERPSYAITLPSEEKISGRARLIVIQIGWL